MAIVTDKVVYLHTPKCGGMWIRNAIIKSGIKYEEIGSHHSHFPELLHFKNEAFWSDRLIFTFIRHPLTWYQSRWTFRMKSGWQLSHPLDANCASNDFRVFVDRALKFRPNGWLTYEFGNYSSNIPGKPLMVGKQENLVDDFLFIMKTAGHEIPEQFIRQLPRTNDSDLDGKPSKYWARYDQTLAHRVCMVENKIISQYYHNYKSPLQFSDQPY